MKKLFLFLGMIFLLSACSSQTATNNYSNSSSDEIANDNVKTDLDSSLIQSKADTKQMTNRTKINNNLELEDLAKDYTGAIIKTNFGDIKVQFYGDKSPLTVNNFMNLAKDGFYNDTKFHRVIKDFMIQGGDPNSKDDDWSNDGTGGPDYRFADEFNDEKLVRGSLAMANAGPNTNGSQFFIVTAVATPWLDGRHTNFGKVVDGLDVVDKIEAVDTNENDHPTKDVIVEGIELVK